MTPPNKPEHIAMLKDATDEVEVIVEELRRSMVGNPPPSATIAFMRKLLEENTERFVPYILFMKHVQVHLKKPSKAVMPKITILDGAFRYYQGLIASPHNRYTPEVAVARSWRNAGTKMAG